MTRAAVSEEDERTELDKVHVERVDGVNGPSTRVPFLFVRAEETSVELAADALARGEADRSEEAAVDETRTEPEGAEVERAADEGVERAAAEQTPDPAPGDTARSEADAAERSEPEGEGVERAGKGDDEDLKIRHSEDGGAAADAERAEPEGAAETERSEAASTDGEASATERSEEEPAGTTERSEPEGEATERSDPAEPVARADASGPGVPGSAEWEAEDADRAAQVVKLLVTVKQGIGSLYEREAAESRFGDGAWETQDALYCAQDAIAYALQVVAGFAAEEAAEGEGEVAVERSEGALIEAFNQMVRSAEWFSRNGATATAEEASMDRSTESPADAATTERSEESTDVQRAMPGSDEFRSIVTEAVTAAVKPLEDRLSAIESEPAPGRGPLLRGAGGLPSDAFLVAVPRGTDEVDAGSAARQALERAMDEVKEPGAKDVLGRHLARLAHPALAPAE